jgi:hypothetical protein
MAARKKKKSRRERPADPAAEKTAEDATKSSKPATTEVAAAPAPTLVELGSEKATIFGMPVPAPDMPAESPSREPPHASQPIEPHDSLMSDPEIPLAPGTMSHGLALVERHKRELFLGSIAMVGLILGFLAIYSLLSPRPRANATTASVAPEPSSSEAEQGVTPPDPAPAPPPATAPDESSPPPTAPSDEPVAAESAASPSPTKPTASTPPATKVPASPPRPPPASTPAGTCNPPYRLDFFGKRVLKPGCS